MDPNNWHGSVLGSECTFHQIAPYIGKMKSAMAREIIQEFTSSGDLILDPFAGSGVIALEALMARREVVCTDINPYAITLTQAKFTAPENLEEALKKANLVMDQVLASDYTTSLDQIPEWVKAFFHPKTLEEILGFSRIVQQDNDSFLMGCLLGILHHQRPGFLSYPSSHQVPYLRTKRFPKETFPDLYEYRPLKPRLIAKINRLYKRPAIIDSNLLKRCYKADVRSFQLPTSPVDAIITSPPYMDALDYARDNRLRLWFLGVDDYKSLDSKKQSLTSFSELMVSFLINAAKWLKEDGYCICVVGEVNKKNKSFDIAKMIADIATKHVGGFVLDSIVTDEIPDIRRSSKRAITLRQNQLYHLSGKGVVDNRERGFINRTNNS